MAVAAELSSAAERALRLRRIAPAPIWRRLSAGNGPDMSATLIIASFVRALGQLGDRRLSRVFWLGIGLALLLLGLVAIGVQALLLWWIGDGMTVPIFGELRWLSTVAGWSAPVVMLLLSVVLFF
jgi:hypothetical protein